MPEKKKEGVRREAAAKRRPEERTAGTIGMSGRLSFHDWSKLKDELVGEIRGSEQLTKEDLAIRINTKD